MMIRRLPAAILTLLLPTAAAALAAAETQPPQARLEMPESSFDFGVILRGAAAVHEFELRNSGNADLLISRIFGDPTTRATGPEAPIPPGGAGRLRIELETLDIIGPTTLRVRFSTNDPDPARERVTVVLQINVDSSLKTVPGYARYVYVQGEAPGTVAHTLWATDGTDLQVLGVESPYPYLGVAFREATPEERRAEGVGRQWRIETTLAPDSTVGPLAGFVVVRVNHPREPLIKLPVSGFVRPIFAATPPEGDVGSLSLTAPRRFRFHLVNFATETIDLVTAETDIAGVEASFEEIKPGREYNVWVQLGPQMPAGRFAGHVKLRTSSSKVPVLELPLRGTIVPPA
jgi:hypothetical protein